MWVWSMGVAYPPVLWHILLSTNVQILVNSLSRHVIVSGTEETCNLMGRVLLIKYSNDFFIPATSQFKILPYSSKGHS